MGQCKGMAARQTPQQQPVHQGSQPPQRDLPGASPRVVSMGLLKPLLS